MSGAMATTLDGRPGEPARSRRSIRDQPAAMHRAWRQSIGGDRHAIICSRNARSSAPAPTCGCCSTCRRPDEPDERYIAAGVPWFSCLFGRDSIITSLQLLSVRPQVAQSTLDILARLQATEVDDFRDAQPGKILHELRTGELARTDEIPHTPYYGTVDATPLWLMLLDEYERWTGDDAAGRPAVAERTGGAALDRRVRRHRRRWLRRVPAPLAARPGQPGLEGLGRRDPLPGRHARRRPDRARRGPGLRLRRAARPRATGTPARRGSARPAPGRCRRAAAGPLRGAVLDGRRGHVRARAGRRQATRSTASPRTPATRCGAASRPRSAPRALPSVLTSGAMWTGWGIRTLSAEMIGYNPIGYHLGTVWPHDNGICAAGFARYGLFEEARKVAGALLEATVHFREARLPELFCGFDRSYSPLPVPYPVACSPQAWAAGALFHIIGATLGMQPERARRPTRAAAAGPARLAARAAPAQPARGRRAGRPCLCRPRRDRSRSRCCVGRATWTSSSDSRRGT